MRAFHSNKDNIMLEFTATCNLKDNNVLTKYQDKIVFNYPLVSFREKVDILKTFKILQQIWIYGLEL